MTMHRAPCDEPGDDEERPVPVRDLLRQVGGSWGELGAVRNVGSSGELVAGTPHPGDRRE
jgi:hypothetical protein